MITTIIAGFPNKAEAIAYGKRHGWTPETTTT